MQTIPLQLNEDFSWQRLLAGSNLTLQQLYQRLELALPDCNKAVQASEDFPLRVPEPYLQRIEPGNPDDPLLLQILPQAEETIAVPGYSVDPLQEANSNPLPGLVHKYQSRVLLILSGGCAINCRYCFRRHFPYNDNQMGKDQWQQILDYLRADTRINEVIFSGGDPLATPDKRLAGFIDDLEGIEHLQRLRIHSRLPVVIPQRITNELVNRLSQSRLQTLMVIHANHANEIDHCVAAALQQMQQAGIQLLNQTVLLKGINDDVDSLEQLSETLFRSQVMPYYLHMLDEVAGAAHFDVKLEQAQALIKALQARLPGYLVPRLVKEEAGKASKTLLNIHAD